MSDTIFALSSGAPPAAIAIIRISGPDAHRVVGDLCRQPLPNPRTAALRALRSPDGVIIDRALVMRFAAPATATGENMVELHCHGGRAVVAAVERALERLGCRRAEAGEFTRRAFRNGRMDLAEAEGLADLLAAETELQRAAAISLTEGRFSAQVEEWRQHILRLSALVEAALDFADDDDAAHLPPSFRKEVAALAADLAEWLSRPRSDRLKEGVRVVIAGPPNSGKSTLFNALVEDEAAITSPEAGTTRDALERNVAIRGVPFTFIDTAGLRDEGAGSIEAIGIGRARRHIDRADLVLWLGPEGEGPTKALEIETRIDAPADLRKRSPDHRVSGRTGEGVDQLKLAIAEKARTILPSAGQVALNNRQAMLLAEAQAALSQIVTAQDDLVIAEHLRQTRVAFDAVLGRTATEDMLDALFGRFCIGK
ncbi:tRNA uridine-5-carboxymethylaminomethyl(34) synthesis GTPase MnmE [Porphyrobacter sp. GA68]|uniref:tRNA uridine-5-carboxymethylaminomethyl(34) synthesis GTPase MnmE n=1 Tax=Porphyrobacter sp. GA68 TaxID=2883480 RepID=UPI001D18C898|nr:tRNA uridine-5-carboxymethylaminomethyl(34) synthesis GTPase MnmE [Porphyrobacter sp. GA68]